MECKLLRFNQDGEPFNPELYKLVEEFWKKEWPSAIIPKFNSYSLVWVVVELKEGKPEVIGMTAISYLVDLPVFHSQSPRAYALMYNRLHDWASDRGIGLLSVYVQPENQDKIKSLMERCSATSAQRWLFQVEPDIEVD